MLAFLKEQIPLISKIEKFILGFALFSIWDVNSYALPLKKKEKILWLRRGLLQLLAAAVVCTVFVLMPAFAWERLNPFKWGGGTKNNFDLHQ